MSDMNNIYATGKRKESVARVWLSKGSGKISLRKNKKNIDINEFFPTNKHHQFRIPLEVTNSLNEIDILCTLKGGGITGQCDALKHGISKALALYNESLKPLLKSKSLLTRDSRKVERKKPGHRKARKIQQFSKR